MKSPSPKENYIMKLRLNSHHKLAIALSILFSVLLLLISLMSDASYIIFSKNSPVVGFNQILGFKEIEGNVGIWIMMLFIIIYIPVVTTVITYEGAYFKTKEGKYFTSKSWIYYLTTFAAGLFLSFGLASLFNIPGGLDGYVTTLTYLYQSLILSLIIFLVVAVLIAGIILAYRGIKTSSIKENHDLALEELLDEQKRIQEEKESDEHNLNKSFNNVTPNQAVSTIQGGQIVASGTREAPKALDDKKEVFKNLTAIDDEYLSLNTIFNPVTQDDKLTLKTFTEDLQNYLATSWKLYYSFKELALFVSALNATKLIILEGISGTGKSSLPRYFMKFLGGEAYFEAIQVTYREKSDLLGYYNEFTSTYHETEFLKAMYRTTYQDNLVNLVVLDEMNISRIEYYFADFLSVMEYPVEDQKINILQLPRTYDAPRHLSSGNLPISPSLFFVGTCNKDDSTFTVTDKVIDRAIILDFDTQQAPLTFSKAAKPLYTDYITLSKLFSKAMQKKDNQLSTAELSTFQNLLGFMYDELGIAIGNRLIHQLYLLAPIYNEITGKKEDALDYVFMTKVLRKLEGRFEASLRPSLEKLEKKITELYGETSFTESRKKIKQLLKRL